MTTTEKFKHICIIADWCTYDEDSVSDLDKLYSQVDHANYEMTKYNLKIANDFYNDLKRDLKTYFPNEDYAYCKESLKKLKLI